MTADNILQLQEAVDAAIEELNEKIVFDEPGDNGIVENNAGYRVSSGFWEKLISASSS